MELTHYALISYLDININISKTIHHIFHILSERRSSWRVWSIICACCLKIVSFVKDDIHKHFIHFFPPASVSLFLSLSLLFCLSFAFPVPLLLSFSRYAPSVWTWGRMCLLAHWVRMSCLKSSLPSPETYCKHLDTHKTSMCFGHVHTGQPFSFSHTDRLKASLCLKSLPPTHTHKGVSTQPSSPFL